MIWVVEFPKMDRYCPDTSDSDERLDSKAFSIEGFLYGWNNPSRSRRADAVIVRKPLRSLIWLCLDGKDELLSTVSRICVAPCLSTNIKEMLSSQMQKAVPTSYSLSNEDRFNDDDVFDFELVDFSSCAMRWCWQHSHVDSECGKGGLFQTAKPWQKHFGKLQHPRLLSIVASVSVFQMSCWSDDY